MVDVAHVIGNGPSGGLYNPARGIKMLCNLPPVAVPNAWATAMVDFKMMHAIHREGVQVPGEWVLGYRPKVYMDKNPSFYMKNSRVIKQFYTELPKYAILDGDVGKGYTNFNCGHMATHYVANQLKAAEIHMYGFDSIFDFDLKSFTDTYLASDRGNNNTARLVDIWRKVWVGMFTEFSDRQFVIHNRHNSSKVQLPNNVEVRTKK